MRKIILVIFLVMLNLFQHLLFAQEPEWVWAKYGLHTGYTEGIAACSDSHENVFLSGFFYGNTLAFENTTLTNADNSNSTADIFVTKYDASGNLLWARSASGAAEDWCYSMTSDTSGNVFLTGFFHSSTITFGNITLTHPGLFVVKYDGSGNVIWARDGIGNSETRSIKTDLSGNVFITGWFNTTTLQLGNITLTNGGFAGIKDFFAAKYDASGAIVWAKSEGGIGHDQGLSISTDSSGSAFVTGDYKSPSITFGNTNLINANSDSTDVFVVKYDGAGNAVWAKRAGGTSSDGGFSIAATPDGTCYVTGWFYSYSFQFGTTTINRVGPYGTKDMFVAKYDSSGNLLWAKSAGGTYDDNAWSISLHHSGNIFIAGGYSGNISFGNISLQSTGGIDPAFIVLYNPDGNEVCAFKLSSGGDDILVIFSDPFGNLFLGGDYAGASGIDGLPVVGLEDAFITKFRFNCEIVISIDKHEENQLTLYPNPATTTLKIESTEISKQTTMKIFNTQGQLVYQSTFDTQHSTFDISSFPTGLYYLHLQSDEGIAMKKFEVMR